MNDCYLSIRFMVLPIHPLDKVLQQTFIMVRLCSARLRNGTPSMTTTEKRRDIVLSCVAACLIVALVAVMAS